MSKGGRASVADMRRVELAILLRVMRDQQATGEPSVLSRRELAEAVGVSEFRIRTALCRLRDGECVKTVARYAETGAQLSNALEITAKGIQRLEDEL